MPAKRKTQADIATEVTDAAVKRQIRVALDAQKGFEEAPELFIQEQRMDVLKETARKYLPGAFGKNATQHAYWCRSSEVDMYNNRGYAPALKDNGDVVTVNELTLTWTTNRMHKARERAFQQESRNRMKQGMKTASVQQTKSPGRDVVAGDAVDTSGITVEQANVQSAGPGTDGE